jgi:hypothetical protein
MVEEFDTECSKMAWKYMKVLSFNSLLSSNIFAWVNLIISVIYYTYINQSVMESIIYQNHALKTCLQDLIHIFISFYCSEFHF